MATRRRAYRCADASVGQCIDYGYQFRRTCQIAATRCLRLSSHTLKAGESTAGGSELGSRTQIRWVPDTCTARRRRGAPAHADGTRLDRSRQRRAGRENVDFSFARAAKMQPRIYQIGLSPIHKHVGAEPSPGGNVGGGFSLPRCEFTPRGRVRLRDMRVAALTGYPPGTTLPHMRALFEQTSRRGGRAHLRTARPHHFAFAARHADGVGAARPMRRDTGRRLAQSR